MNGEAGSKQASASMIVSISSAIIIALIGALWVNLNQVISDLRAEVRGLDVAMSDMRVSMMEMKGRYDKLVDIYNRDARRK